MACGGCSSARAHCGAGRCGGIGRAPRTSRGMEITAQAATRSDRPPAVFHRPPCFVFHYFQRPCVSLCFVFQNLGGAVKARVSCFVFQIFRACSAPAARLASGGACGGLSPLRDENLLRAAWISPTRGNGRNFRRKPVLPRPHMYVWPPARVGQAGLYLQTALKVVDS